jgi:hypothetical protein
MDSADKVLWALLIVGLILAVSALWRRTSSPSIRESFINKSGLLDGVDLTNISTQALDSAPTTSELKQHYKTLLVFADADIRKQGTQSLRILADFRDRVYGKRNFRDNLKTEDILANWPTWLPPLDTTIDEPAPDSTAAVTAESQMLAYLQKNYPQEDNVDEQTGSTIRNLIDDFGFRFVFKKGEEKVRLGDDFLKEPLLKGWTNPAARPN